MMQRVHAYLLGAQRACEPRSADYGYCVDASLPRQFRVVGDRTRELGGEVLHEGAAEAHVDQLNAAADGQCRQAPSPGRPHQREFEGVTCRMDVAERRHRSGVVVTGIHILAPSEQEAVHAIQHRVSGVRREHGQDVGPKSDRIQGIGV